MHKKRKHLHEKGSWYQIDDAGAFSTPFGSCRIFERKDRIERKYVSSIGNEGIRKRKRFTTKASRAADLVRRKHEGYYSFSRHITDVKLLVKIAIHCQKCGDFENMENYLLFSIFHMLGSVSAATG